MGDYGIRVSKEGVDVKTGDDKDMILTSKYPLMKEALSGGGTVTLVSGVQYTLTIAHSLGYIPFMTAYIDDGFGKFSISPVWADSATETLSVYTKTDANYGYIIFYWENYVSGGTKSLKYKYFIYLDKGKL